MRKTIEQERAFYCLKCVERLRLAKNGKWFELKDFGNQYNLKSDNFNDFHKYRFYNGIKSDLFNDFVSWFMNEKNNNQLRSILQNLNQDENKAKKELSEFFYEGKDLNNQNVKNQISQIYSNFTFDFSKYDYTSDYSSHAKRLPQMIISNGLIPTLAFYKSKGKDRDQIYTDICEILEVTGFKPYLDWKNKNNKEGSLLLEFLLETDSQTLLLATIEVLAIANWLKRIVEAEIKED
ncbi:MAG: type III-B CRISPR module-associated protein Cmr5 [Sulfurihydrogenibium sp.]|jgi:CRISPR-associated protein Cmr5|nr:type III-B CRISPR module-associated protein Cmr5 [Sulfurihydrogenibium sp.]